MEVILIGFMGSGKTTVSQLLGHQLNQTVHDLDQEIVKTAQLSIPEIFQQHGEDYFRNLEHQVLDEMVDKEGILATGGGTPLREDNRRILQQTHTPVIWLQANPANTLERIHEQAGDRPLGDQLDVNGVQRMQADREAFYRECADRVVNTDQLRPTEVVNQILEVLDQAALS